MKVIYGNAIKPEPGYPACGDNVILLQVGDHKFRISECLDGIRVSADSNYELELRPIALGDIFIKTC